MDQSAKIGPKEIFLHLLAILTLYFSAGSFLALVFQYINYWFPDPLEGPRFHGFGAIRFALSSLIVVFPAYLLTTRYLNKIYLSNPIISQMRIRKWLIYFTLFAAALIMIGDFVALVNGLLGGELTTRFILKVITVFFVAASVFYYYRFDLQWTKGQ